MKTFKQFVEDVAKLASFPKPPTPPGLPKPIHKLVPPTLTKQHPPTIDHTTTDAIKARKTAERQREAEKNKREAEQRHQLAQAHREANK